MSATWKIELIETGLSLTYRNQWTGEEFNCGMARADTPPRLILEWILLNGDSRPGDSIRMPDGTLHWVQKPGRA